MGGGNLCSNRPHDQSCASSRAATLPIETYIRDPCTQTSACGEGSNAGYDENDRWLGMTPEEVAIWLEQMREEFRRLRQKWFLEPWTPDAGEPRAQLSGSVLTRRRGGGVPANLLKGTSRLRARDYGERGTARSAAATESFHPSIAVPTVSSRPITW
jgi:hypothetical protein